MGKLISEIVGFVQTVAIVSLVGTSVSLLAREVRLNVLRKAAHGSTKLSGFTQKMIGNKGF
jgi:hypothetical protein